MNRNTLTGIFTVLEFNYHSEKFAYGCIVNKGKDRNQSLILKIKISDNLSLIKYAKANWIKGLKIFASGELRQDEYNGKSSLVFIVHQAYTIFEDSKNEVPTSSESINEKPPVVNNDNDELFAASANISDDLIKF